MVHIKLIQKNFDLVNNKHFLPILEEAEISQEQYNELIKPFLCSTYGKYYVNAKTLGRKFCLNGISLTGILDYLSNKTDSVIAPIRDIKSAKIESVGLIKNPDAPYFWKPGIAVKSYSKQTGSITFRKIDGKEERIIQLENIIKEQIWQPTAILSDRAVDNVLYGKY